MKEKQNKFCQSCGMPLEWKEEKLNGTEADGTLSLKYCKYCYKDGAFTQPDITIEEIHKAGKEGIKQSERMGWLFKRMILMFYTKRSVKKLERWKTK